MFGQLHYPALFLFTCSCLSICRLWWVYWRDNIIRHSGLLVGLHHFQVDHYDCHGSTSLFSFFNKGHFYQCGCFHLISHFVSVNGTMYYMPIHVGVGKSGAPTYSKRGFSIPIRLQHPFWGTGCGDEAFVTTKLQRGGFAIAWCPSFPGHPFCVPL